MTVSLIERFMAKITHRDKCWIWTAATTGGPFPYGQFSVNGRMRLAHRVAYEHFIGPIPPGKVIDHLCREPLCVQPEHLEAVTPEENARRAQPWRPNLAKIACPAGHPYDETNTIIDRRGHRQCRECSRQHARAWKAKRKRSERS